MRTKNERLCLHCVYLNWWQKLFCANERDAQFRTCCTSVFFGALPSFFFLSSFLFESLQILLYLRKPKLCWENKISVCSIKQTTITNTNERTRIRSRTHKTNKYTHARSWLNAYLNEMTVNECGLGEDV